MATAVLDIDGSRFLSSWTPGRSQYRRMARVDNIAATDIMDQYAEVFAALPASGTILDAQFNALVLLDRTIESLEHNGSECWAICELMYGIADGTIVGSVPSDNGPGVTTAGASVVPFESMFDPQGNEITTTIIGATKTIRQRHVFQSLRPQSTPEFTRREQSSPRARADLYVGKLNAGTWNGYPDKTVLCAGITGYREYGSTTYINTYRFEYRPDGWTQTYIHEDPAYPGFPLKEPLASNEFVEVEPFDSISFSGLNIIL